MRNPRQRFRRQAILIVAIASFICGGHIYLRFVQEPHQKAWSEALKRVPATSVTRIVVSPTGHPFSISDSFEITKHATIERICEILAASDLYSPNHPVPRWECCLTIETGAHAWKIEIHETSHDEAIAYGPWNATLRINDFSAIRHLLDADANAKTNKAQQSRPLNAAAVR